MPMRAAALLLLLLVVSACASAPGRRTLARPVDGDALPPRVVILTYDDGPDEHTLEIARWLHEQSPPIQATFFVNGRRFCKVIGDDGQCREPAETRPCDDGESQKPVAHVIYYPEALLDELTRLGHRIGNHSQDHCHLMGQRAAASLVWEIATTQALLDRHGAAPPTLFRPPYLEWSKKQASFAASDPALARLRGPVEAELDGEDWDCWQKQMSVEQCGERYLELLRGRRRHNGIILIHDRPEMTVGYEGPLRLTEWLVTRLRGEGYRFGTFASDAAAALR
jgi:peptidoglycan/xylan/chitin deacetylase (PgdA/CDA1 family)